MIVSRLNIAFTVLQMLNNVTAMSLDDIYDNMENYFLKIYPDKLPEDKANFVYDELTQTLFKMVMLGLINAMLTPDMEIKLSATQKPQITVFMKMLLELETLLESDVLIEAAQTHSVTNVPRQL